MHSGCAAMYKSSYSQPALGLAAKRTIKKPQGKSCGYYMRLVFLFSSLIQSLIIVSLVLFLVYGRSSDAATEGQMAKMEKSFTRVSMDNLILQQQKKNLTQVLNATQTEKKGLVKDLAKINELLNNSSMIINSLNRQQSQFDGEKRNLEYEIRKLQTQTSIYALPCQDLRMTSQKELNLLKNNFTHTVEHLKAELANTAKDRDTLTLETIALRRDKKSLEAELENYKKKCKQDFVQSLDGISNVSRTFLQKINNLVPNICPFMITCKTQSDQLNLILNNCTSLSREVETKFQHYLDNVGTRVSEIQSISARLEAQKAQLAEDNSWCSQNRSAMAREHSMTLQKNQEKYDTEKERLILDLKKLQGDTALKDVRINILTEQTRNYNATLANCVPRTSVGNPLTNPGPGGVGTGRIGPGGVVTGGTGGLPALGNTGMGGARQSTPGQGTKFGSIPAVSNSYTRMGNTGMGGAGSISAGSSGTGVGNTMLDKLWPGATHGVNRSPSGTGLGWPGSSVAMSGGARTTGVGMGNPNSYSSATINQHLRELQKYLNPNSGKEVSG
ncbi:plasmalemma vesicle associated protein a [Esox lucius]|uniref:plasmalemma vesicle associated protein a n=1 Tax=Esox lucius TaxID=8010 RepID=UPI0014769AA8|nr:plasmalemma vesicle associated protein a [Esox lucius]